jgi:hypothetical protein
MGIPGSIGQHLMKGRLVLAHVWDSHGKAWMSLMCEAPDRNTTPPVHGPYTDMDTAKKAAELGFGYPKIPLAR